jgi:hypothetical protein
MRMSEPRFFVAWQIPPALREGDVVLSFLAPEEEEALARRGTHRVDSARALAQQLRAQAFETFVTIAARIGIVQDARGRTLRSALQRRGEGSDWWFHRVSSRTAGPEDRTLFEGLLTALVIDHWANSHGARTLHVHGAAGVLVTVLRSKYAVVASETSSAPLRQRLRWPFDALRERVWCLMWTWQTARRAPRPAIVQAGDRRPIVALTGHSWLTWDEPSGEFVDAHFKGIDASLRARGFRVLRLLWYLPGQPGRYETPDAAGDAFTGGHASALQAFVTRWDILRETCSFRALRVYLRWSRRRSFRAVFRVGSLDLFALFSGPLLGGFLGGDVPLARLGALATARACDAYRPFATVCHWEWFFDGRAHYEGVRRSRYGTMPTTMQHGANTAVLFYHVDAGIEFRGEPDGCRPPCAQHVFVMGRAGFERFLASGYGPQELTLTGSTRFDITALRAAVRARKRLRAPGALARPVRLLVLPSSLARDADLIEAAYAAADGLTGLEVYVRKKPGSPSNFRPSTARIGPRLQCTDASLEDDFAAAHLVMFSASTAADQAFACGIPTWQWLPVNLQGTSLTDVVPLRQFHSVKALRDALKVFVHSPDARQPREQDVARAIEQIFGRVDGLESERIADGLRALFDERAGGTITDARAAAPLRPSVARAPQDGVPV